MDGVVRYEAKWSRESGWEECTQEDYENIIHAEREGIEARALGVITDEGGLLLSGPEGFKSWRAAAVHERFLRVELEKSVRDALESEGGPEGFKSWRAAAVHERFLRVNLETSLREALESEGNQEKKLKKIKSLLEKASDAAR